MFYFWYCKGFIALLCFSCFVVTFSFNSHHKTKLTSHKFNIPIHTIDYRIKRIKKTKLHVVEHLIDCENNKMILNLLNDNSYCLNPTDGLLSDIRGFIQQVANIGFLVIAYYILKRTSGGMREWNTEDGDKIEKEFNSKFPNKSSSLKSRKKRDRCPLCDGTGNYISKTNLSGQCELCDGKGYIVKVKTLSLPSEKDFNEY